MRKIFLIFLLCFSFLDAYIDEYKSDVYFANGIDTNEKTAKRSVDEIKEDYKIKYPQKYNSVKDWDIVYNHTHGIGIDLYESMIQKVYEDDVGSSLVPFIWNIGEISDYFVLSFKGVVSRVARKIPKDSVKEYSADAAKKLAKKAALTYNAKYGKKLTQEEIELMFNEVFDFLIEKSVDAFVTQTEEEILEQERADVDDHLKAYRQSVIDGHGVIVVAHSQGNLFVNRAYNELGKYVANHDEWMKPFIHAIGVASPANNILGEDSPYITFDNDMIQLVPDSLPTNVTNPTRYYFTNAANEQVETIFSVKAHSFLTSYMATDITRNTILDFIDDKIDEHKKADSQWEKDSKGTTEHLITVKHRLEPTMSSIMSGVEVYPFNTDKKLYYVDGNTSGYVKASCGGTKIKDTWKNQQDNEAYSLWDITSIIDILVINSHNDNDPVDCHWGNINENMFFTFKATPINQGFMYFWNNLNGVIHVKITVGDIWFKPSDVRYEGTTCKMSYSLRFESNYSSESIKYKSFPGMLVPNTPEYDNFH